jgi:23S rRNA (adenine2503-C2)-methyltransferase
VSPRKQPSTPVKIDLRGLTLTELEELLGAHGEPRYRAAQVASWVFERGATTVEAMTDLPKSLRDALARESTITSTTLVRTERSAVDGTEKLLLEYPDRTRIEAVVLRDEGRVTGCISTQVGCRFGCSFCATGSMGFVRDLTAGEIVEEIVALRRHVAPERLDNLVFMGMGEPLDNYDPTLKAVHIANAAWGLGIGARRITISTAGHVPGIRRLADEPLQLNLAVSLNAPNQALRTEIMPIAGTYPLGMLLDALKEYTNRSGRRVSLEYLLLREINDSLEMADELATIARSLLAKVNLICYNEVRDGAYAPPKEVTVERFFARLRSRCPTVVRRVSRGSDISAGCGQLCVPRDRATR